MVHKATNPEPIDGDPTTILKAMEAGIDMDHLSCNYLVIKVLRVVGFGEKVPAFGQ
jgi:hypothetical protein